MKVLHEWFIEACMKPKLQQTPADELIIIVYPLLIVGIIAAAIMFLVWIIGKIRKD